MESIRRNTQSTRDPVIQLAFKKQFVNIYLKLEALQTNRPNLQNDWQERKGEE